MYSIQHLLDRFDGLKTGRSNFEYIWQEIADNLLGRRDFVTKRSPGERRDHRIYDSTAFKSTELLSAALHSMLTNTESTWFGLSLEDMDRMRHPDAVKWMEAATEITAISFSRPQANFTPQAHELYFDLVAFGTGAQYIEEVATQGAMFSSRPLQETYISEDRFGRVDTVFRKFELTARNAVAAFPDPGMGPRRFVHEGKPDELFEFLHVVLPNDQLVPGNKDWTGMPYSEYYISIQDKAPTQPVRGHWEMPYQTPRWVKDAGEMYGRGPGVVALPDAMMLNEMSRTTLKGAQKAVDPPGYMPNDGILSNLRFQPGGITIVDSNFFERTNGQPISFQQQVANVGLGVEMEERRAKSVQRAFHHELLQMFEDPRMTATQVLELSRTAQRLLSPVLGRQRVEYLEPMVERVFGINLRMGKFPEIPDVLQGQDIKIDYISPVSRAQKADEANAVTRVLSQALEVAQVDPSVMDNFDLDATFRYLAEANNVPSKVMSDPRVMKALREARAKQQEAQRKHEMMMEAGQMAARLEPGMAKAEQMRAAA